MYCNFMQGRQYYLLALGLLIYINNLLVFLTGFEFIDAHQQFDYTARCGKKSIPGAAIGVRRFYISLEIPRQLRKYTYAKT